MRSRFFKKGLAFWTVCMMVFMGFMVMIPEESEAAGILSDALSPCNDQWYKENTVKFQWYVYNKDKQDKVKITTWKFSHSRTVDTIFGSYTTDYWYEYASVVKYTSNTYYEWENFPDGRFMWRVEIYYKNCFGNYKWYSTSDKEEFRHDSTPPDTPSPTQAYPYGYLRWSPITDAGIGLKHYEWRIDGGTIHWTTSRFFYLPSGLTSGSHLFEVRAVDKLNHASLWGYVYFKYDGTAPIIYNHVTGDDVWRNAGGTKYNVDFSDPISPTLAPGSKLNYAYYYIHSNQFGQTPRKYLGGGTIFSGLDSFWYTTDWEIDFDACQEGANYVYLYVRDYATNSQSQNDVFCVLKDTVPPGKTIPNDGEPYITDKCDLTFSWPTPYDATSGIDHYEYRLDTEPTNTWHSTTTNSATLTGLPDGRDTFNVRPVDKAGNIGTVGSHLFWVQTVPPEPNADAGGPYNGVEHMPITFDASASTDPNSDPLQYRWDFQNDGTWDTGFSNSPTAAHTWHTAHSGTVKVEVSDGWYTDTDTAAVVVKTAVAKNIDQNKYYAAIQDAIDDATSGDTIQALSGTHNENLLINKKLTLVGEDRDHTVINAGGSGNVIKITADHVTVKDLTVTNSGTSSGWPGDAGIRIDNADYCSVENVNASDNNNYGLILAYADNSLIKNNYCTDNRLGICTYGDNNNEICYNYIDDNVDGGMKPINSGGSGANQIHNNTIVNNGFHPNPAIITAGIILYGGATKNNIIEHNLLDGNRQGIHCRAGGSSNVIRYNAIINCTVAGVQYSAGGGPNTYYHNNFINNTVHTSGTTSSDVWDNGYPMGGNYWDTYSGTDIYHGAVQNKAGADGMGDTTYTLSGGAKDNYPWMAPDGWLRVTNLDTGKQYFLMQQAVDDASPGDTLRAKNSVYFEHLMINKKITLIGESRDGAMVTGGGSGNVIKITSDDVTVMDLTVTNCGSTPGYLGDAGIRLDGVKYCTIMNVNASDNNNYGINLVNSDCCWINNNYIDNNEIGIFCWYADDCEFGNNYISNNPENGIQLANSGSILPNWVHDNTLIGNAFTSVTHPTAGIFLWGGFSKNNLIEDNMLDGNKQGIHFRASGIKNNIICGNTIKNCPVVGVIYTHSAGPNTFYHNNFINNAVHLIGTISGDNWDDGYPNGGNYWDTYSGTDVYHGPSQNIAGSDGIGDSAYSLVGSGKDNYPWLTPGGWDKVKNTNTGKWYLTIQSAVDNANLGDSLWAANGNYYENVVINKMLTLTGESRDGVVVNASGTGDVITITADWVNIKYLTATNSRSSYPDAGVKIDSANHCWIENINASNNHAGIFLYYADNCVVNNNFVTNNLAQGIYSHWSTNNEFGHNYLYNNPHAGIQLSSGWYGGIFTSTDSWTHNNTCIGNGFQWYGGAGIYLWGGGSINNLIENNLCDGNNNGMQFRAYGITNNIVRGNTIQNSALNGVYYTNGAGPNTFYLNNFINNTAHLSGTISSDKWDNGYPSGGNYWDTYSGTDNYHGAAQNIAGGDGMGDSAYSVAGGGKDNYPWMKSSGWRRVKNQNTGAWYYSIQMAIDNAATGHTLFVTEGNYYENVVVDENVTILGEDMVKTVVDGSGSGDVITVTASWVTIKRLTVTNSGSSSLNSGLKLDHVKYCRVEEVNASNNGDLGIGLFYSSLCRVNKCNVSNNKLGIYSHWTTYSEFGWNYVYNNPNNGIQTASGWQSGVNTETYSWIHNSTFIKNAFTSASHPTAAIFLWGSGSNHNLIENNWLDGNKQGIHCRASGITDNLFRGNTIANCTVAGVRYTSSAGPNKFYHNNFISNTAHLSGGIRSTDVWDDGYPSGGNYWDTYTGVDKYKGVNQNILGSDGIGDTAYSVLGGGTDRYPLMGKYGLPDAPVADAGGPYSSQEGEAVLLNASDSYDPDLDTLKYRWDFDNDGTWDTSYSTSPTVNHIWYDNGIYTVKVEAFDGTYKNDETALVTILNVAPSLTISGLTNTDEGMVYTLSLSSTDPGSDTISQWVIDWGDGTVKTITGNPPTVAHTYTDGPNTYTIYANATDEDGTYDSDNSILVIVSNLEPTLIISGPASIDEGSTYTLGLSAADAGDDTISKWTIDWGDGSVQTINGNPPSVTHTYIDGDNTYTISATATDEDGTSDAGNTVMVTVNNVDPTLTISGVGSINEGSIYTLGLSASDPGDDTIQKWVINWGDGTIDVITGNPPTVTHTYTDGPDGFTIKAAAIDEDGSYNAGNEITVTVNNVVPVLTLSGSSTTDEGAVYTLTLSSTDPGDDTITQLEIDWDDGTVETFPGTTASATHTYIDGPINYMISASATDEDGTHPGDNTISLSVKNLNPVVVAGVDQTMDECTIIYLDPATFTDAGISDTHVAHINWSDGLVQGGLVVESAGSGTVSGQHMFYDDGVYVVNITVVDNDGGVGFDNFTVTVNNVAPEVDILNVLQPDPNMILKDDLLLFEGTFIDPGLVDTFTIKWDFDDGTVIYGNLTPTHAYSEPGSYNVTFTVTDDDLGVDQDWVLVNVTTQSNWVEEQIENLENILQNLTGQDKKDVKDAIKLLDKAAKLFEDNKIDKAIKKVDKAIKLLEDIEGAIGGGTRGSGTRGNAEEIPPEVLEVIFELVEIVKGTVDRELVDAVFYVGMDNSHIEKALKHYDKAFDNLIDGKFSAAIKELGKVHKESLKARGEWIPEGLETTAHECIQSIEELIANTVSDEALGHLNNATTKLNKAIKKMEKNKMEQAIVEFKGAIKELEMAMAEDEGADTTEIIDDLLEGTEDSVYQKITDAESVAGSDNKDIKKAWQKFEKALLEVEAGNYDKAMNLYKEAVKKAEKAVKA